MLLSSLCILSFNSSFKTLSMVLFRRLKFIPQKIDCSLFLEQRTGHAIFLYFEFISQDGYIELLSKLKSSSYLKVLSGILITPVPTKFILSRLAVKSLLEAIPLLISQVPFRELNRVTFSEVVFYCFFVLHFRYHFAD